MSAVELCEWDPERDRLAVCYPDGTGHVGCHNPAELVVSKVDGGYHLCPSCAELPRFRRMRYREPLGRSALEVMTIHEADDEG